jgi:hypothetical protein
MTFLRRLLAFTEPGQALLAIAVVQLLLSMTLRPAPHLEISAVGSGAQVAYALVPFAILILSLAFMIRFRELRPWRVFFMLRAIGVIVNLGALVVIIAGWQTGRAVVLVAAVIAFGFMFVTLAALGWAVYDDRQNNRERHWEHWLGVSVFLLGVFKPVASNLAKLG